MVEISYFIALGFLVLPALDYFVGLRVLPDVVPSGEKDEKSSVGADGVSVIIACHNEASNIKRKVLEITSQLCGSKGRGLYKFLQGAIPNEYGGCSFQHPPKR